MARLAGDALASSPAAEEARMFWSRMTEPVLLCEFYSHKRGDHAVLSNFYPYEFTAIFVVQGVRHELEVANSEAHGSQGHTLRRSGLSFQNRGFEGSC